MLCVVLPKKVTELGAAVRIQNIREYLILEENLKLQKLFKQRGAPNVDGVVLMYTSANYYVKTKYSGAMCHTFVKSLCEHTGSAFLLLDASTIY